MVTVKENQKYASLDGLRGLAALMVVFHHYVLAFAPFLLGFEVTARHQHLGRLVASSPLQLPLNGNLFVCIFFVLSGFVLSLSFFRHKTMSVLVSSMSRRYFRLAIPAVCSVVLAYLVLRLFGSHTGQAAHLSGSNQWLGSIWNFPPHLAGALWQGLYGAFFTDGYIGYNNVLWTMHYELFGSFLVFVFLAFCGKLPNRWLAYAVVAVACRQTYYLAFIIGVLMCDLLLNYPRAVGAVKSKWVAAALPVGLLLGSWPSLNIYTAGRAPLPHFSPLGFITLMHVVGAAIIVVGVLKLRPLAWFMTLKPLQVLGRLSFSLYLVHLIVISSFASVLFGYLVPRLGYGLSVLLTAPPSVGLSLLLAVPYSRFIDQPSIAISKRLGNLITGQPTPAVWLSALDGRFRRRPGASVAPASVQDNPA